MTAYYNEIDKGAAAWLRELIKRGLIAEGDVDETDIRDVEPDRLARYTQCHFFAGIGGWSLALRLAGWPDNRPVWTGSCPCQPFSAAGRRAGTADERHLWPHWHHLISQCQPPIIFGEQVASRDGLGWLDLVSADLEATGYAVGAADMCAAGIGAPHIRQRLWFVGERLADAADAGLQIGRRGSGREPGSVEQSERLRADGGMADADSAGWVARQRDDQAAGHGHPFAAAGGDGGMADTMPAGRAEGWAIAGHGSPAGDGICGRLADADDARSQGWSRAGGADQCASGPGGMADGSRPTNGHWGSADWLFCRDERWRPVEPGTFPLAHGVPARVGRLRGYGNAIVPQVAATFIRSVM